MATFPTPDKVTGKYAPVSSLMTGTFCPLITTNCENTDAALAFIDYWTEDQNLLAWNGSVQFGRVPSGIVCWETDGIDQYWPDLKKAYLAGDLFKNVQPMPAFAGLTSGQSYLAEALQKVLLDVATPQEALDEVAKKLSAEL
jgi:ABC-type glycerol-3-phosphate transport system substrate-binding protein